MNNFNKKSNKKIIMITIISIFELIIIFIWFKIIKII